MVSTPPAALAGIRQLADRLGLPLSTLHYWERRGLVEPHRRGGQRHYDPDQVHRLALIQIWRATGLMSLDEIAAVLRGRTAAGDWRDVVAGRIGAIEAQLAQLHTARDYLAHMLACPRDNPAEECPKLRDEVNLRLLAPNATAPARDVRSPTARPRR